MYHMVTDEFLRVGTRAVIFLLDRNVTGYETGFTDPGLRTGYISTIQEPIKYAGLERALN